MCKGCAFVPRCQIDTQITLASYKIRPSVCTVQLTFTQVQSYELCDLCGLHGRVAI